MVIDLKNVDPVHATCPACGEGGESTHLLFQGMHVLGEYQCAHCHVTYFHTMPVGHDALFPFSFTNSSNQSDHVAPWLTRPLLKSMSSAKKEVTISRKIIGSNYHSSKKKAVLVLTLDTCFGHVITKLCSLANARITYPDYQLIAIIPANMEWLLPAYIDEAWLVDLPINQMDNFLGGLHEYIYEQTASFSEVLIYPVPVYADLELVDFRDFLKINPFPLHEFSVRPFTITFITRDDRFWHGSLPEELFFKACVHWKILDLFQGYFRRRQNRLIRKTRKKIASAFPDAIFNVVGLGKSGGIPHAIHDLRKSQLSVTDEREWMETYADSQIVIGVHGSNMIIPTILAAGFIEIIPDYKLDHIGEDTMKNYDSRLTQFLCRHVSGTASPASIAKHVISLRRMFPMIYQVIKTPSKDSYEL
jgi:hypothetical protein